MTIRPIMKALAHALACGLVTLQLQGCTTAARSAKCSTRAFHLLFQLSDFVVPAGEIWRLSWKSTYQSGETCPSYDVRVEHGHARLGAVGEIQASARDWRPRETGALELSAVLGDATIWLDSGTRFTIANDRLKIDVEIFQLRSAAINAGIEKEVCAVSI